MTGAPVTLLFTDLVESTALLQRLGDERAQRVLRAHRQLLRAALASHGGTEVKWLGDALLTTFASPADGVRCAVTMAQRARRPVAGERLGLRLGLHVGEVLPDEASDYVGTPAVLARRLCDRATAGRSSAAASWSSCCTSVRGSRSGPSARSRSRASPSPSVHTR